MELFVGEVLGYQSEFVASSFICDLYELYLCDALCSFRWLCSPVFVIMMLAIRRRPSILFSR